VARPGLEPGTPRFSVVPPCVCKGLIYREFLSFCVGLRVRIFPHFASVSRAKRQMARVACLFTARDGTYRAGARSGLVLGKTGACEGRVAGVAALRSGR
jgi:hypothetical protein